MRSRVAAGVAAVIVAVTVGVALALGPHGPRVLLVGDSLLQESAPQATRELHGAGFRVDVRAVPGVGLLDSRFDWIAEVGRLVVRDRPRVVVAELAGDYEPPYRPGIGPFSPAFFRAWDDAARRLVATAGSTGAAVELVLVPPMRDRVLDTSACVSSTACTSPSRVPAASATRWPRAPCAPAVAGSRAVLRSAATALP